MIFMHSRNVATLRQLDVMRSSRPYIPSVTVGKGSGSVRLHSQPVSYQFPSVPTNCMLAARIYNSTTYTTTLTYTNHYVCPKSEEAEDSSSIIILLLMIWRSECLPAKTITTSYYIVRKSGPPS